ncbi:hypothetical protein Dsin_003930 [Dipteronia sinensis]|uniref:Uncharacterized protein n=1 Tax=Dipteronia sinensis TaxID=43782 RepID=A0AAE0B9V1_9ROSI|nr:hypothetical protein Dsin_003930 [Dipteronia sinensis]
MQVAVGHLLVLLTDIGVIEGAYLLRVVLPGVRKGQVDPMFSSTYQPGGILEVIVRKRKFPYNTPEMAAGIQLPSLFLLRCSSPNIVSIFLGIECV